MYTSLSLSPSPLSLHCVASLTLSILLCSSLGLYLSLSLYPSLYNLLVFTSHSLSILLCSSLGLYLSLSLSILLCTSLGLYLSLSPYLHSSFSIPIFTSASLLLPLPLFSLSLDMLRPNPVYVPLFSLSPPSLSLSLSLEGVYKAPQQLS